MSDPEPIPTRKSIDQLNGSFENFDVLSITKKIQQQTRSIEDEIVKVQEILRKQQENSIQKSISKQSLMKEHHARQNLRQQVKNTTNSDNSPQNLELARQSQSLDPRGQVPGEVPTGGLRKKTNLNYQNNQETAEILSKIQKPGANRSPQPINQAPLHGIPEKIPANTNAKTSRLDENGNGDQLNSLKMKRRLKPSESSNPQVQGFANDYQDGSTNLNVQVPFIKQRPGEAPQNQVHGQSGQDINQMRDKFFSSNNKQDFNNLPNNTFHKLFNNPNQQPMERNGANIKPHHSDSIKPDDINGKQGLPPISYEAGQSPQQIVKQKARRLAQASNDRRGMESLPNPNQMRESLDIQGLKGYGGGPSQSNNTFTPLRGGETGSNKFKNSSGQLIQNDDDNGPPQFKGNNDTQLRRAKFASSNTNNDNLSKSSNVGLGSQIQQKVAMNNFLTPIVFVSNNYHGVQPNGPGNGNRNSDFQEFVDFDQIKNQMAAGFGATGQNQHIQMGYPQNSTQPLNRDIIFEEQEGTARDGIQDQKSQGYLPPLQQKSQFQSMKQGIQAFAGGNQIQRGLGNRGSGGGLNKNYLNENSSSVTPETITNLAGEQARLGAMLSKMPANTTLYRQQVQNQPSPQMNQIHKYPQYANSQRGPPEPFVQRFVIDSNNYNNGGVLSPKKQRGGSLPPQYNINQASPARLGKGQWGYDGSQQQQYIDEEEEEENSRQDPRYGQQNNYHLNDSMNLDSSMMEGSPQSDQAIQDEQMRNYCENLEYFIQTANPKLDLIMSRIRLNHPIFKQISASTFSYLIERSFLFKLMNGFGAYQEGFRAMNNIYFVLYGELKLYRNGQPFGDPLVMGYTLGEEILFSDRDPILRMESCLATSPIEGGAALLQVNVDEFIKMGTTGQMRISRGASMMRDFKVLMGILQNNFEMKQLWRDNPSSAGSSGLPPGGQYAIAPQIQANQIQRMY